MKRLAVITVGVLLALFMLGLLWEFRSAVGLFVFSLALAAAVRAPVEALTARGFRRNGALLLVYGLGALALAAGLYTLSGPLLSELQLATNQFAAGYDRMFAEWPQGAAWQRAVVNWLPPPAHLFETLTNGSLDAALFGVVGVTLTTFEFLAQAVGALFLSLYWSLDRVRFERLWLSLLPVDQRARARSAWREMENGVGAYLRSAVLRLVVAATVLAAGYWLLGLPYAWLLALTNAWLWTIPWLGTLLALAITLTAAGLLDGPGLAVLAALLTLATFLAIAALDNRVLGRRQYSALLAVLALLALLQDWGLAGLLVAPALAAALQVIVNTLTQRPGSASPEIARRVSDLEQRLTDLQARAQQSTPPPAPQAEHMTRRLGGLLERSRALLQVSNGNGPSWLDWEETEDRPQRPQDRSRSGTDW